MDQLASPQDEIKALLAFMGKSEASDLHLKVGNPPYFRIAGQLRKIQRPDIPDSEYVQQMLIPFIPPGRLAEFDQKGDLDFSAADDTGDRYRINMFCASGHTNAAIRRVQSNIPNFRDLHLPDIYRQTITHSFEGLILVSGVTGSGKSSTLAAMLDYINEHRSMHVISVEDPIEFTFRPNKCIISQREIGIDVPNFADALRRIVRQDPDCILIGEMRDRETMLTAIQAAETGHLVLGTLHCSDTQQAFSRILEFFPREEHAFIRSSLANSLNAMMCQKLVPGVKEGSRYPATEVLLNNPTLKDKIVHEEDEDIPAIISQSREEGMRNFTTSLCELVQAELVDRHTALEHSTNREKLVSELKGIKAASDSLVGRIRG